MAKTVRKLKAIGSVATEPVSLETARLHLRLDTEGSPPSHPDDALVTALITVAREAVENFTELTVAVNTFQLKLDYFENLEIDLGTYPVNSITSITYVDTNGATQTISSSDYVLDTFSKPAQIVLAYAKQWPAVRNQPNAVTVTFEAGYTGDTSPVTNVLPKALTQAMLLTITDLYENRGAIGSKQNYEIPVMAQYLMAPYRINMGP
ncbi:MAG: hypothetical protein EHM12_09425 [Dehalococcoidia bacterium]|jgi:uncharacterized phiE125 gp8 family phage protein|nr:MAG: hypothetical protein EHM12_09425 [Dehalococcoidia bacterium]